MLPPQPFPLPLFLLPPTKTRSNNRSNAFSTTFALPPQNHFLRKSSSTPVIRLNKPNFPFSLFVKCVCACVA